MNSYSLAISGSWVLFIVLALLIIGVSFYSYRNTNPPISGLKKTILISLRILGMLLLLFAIFQPIVTNSFDEVIKPKIAFLLDNSESISIKDASIDRKNVYSSILKEIQEKATDDDVYFSFSDNVNDLKFDSLGTLNTNGKRTDISKAIRELEYRQDTSNIQAVVLLTDGSYNAGENPFYLAQSFGKPVFTVGVGDTNSPKDLKITDLITNEVSYINTPTPIFINLDANGIYDREVNVKVTTNGKLVGEEKVKLDKNQNRYKLKFSFTPDKPGNYKLNATVDGFDDEITKLNNSKSDIIRVLENKKSIALFGGRPSYDVSFLIKELTKNRNQELHKYVQKNATNFYDEFKQKDLQEAEIIILVGYPNASTDIKYLELIKRELDRGKPLFFIASSDIDYNKLSKLGDHVPFTVLSEGRNEMEVLPSVNAKEVGNSILRVNGDNSDIEKWNALPPISKTETFIKPNPEANILMNYTFGNSSMNEPLILSRTLGNKRGIFILGYGLQRWKLKGYAGELSKGKDALDLYSQLMDNSVRWLSIDNSFDSFVLKTNKRTYTEGESVEFIAQLYDDSYLPVEEAKIAVQVKSSNNDTKEILLSDLGNGQYYYKLDNLSKGDYDYLGKASIGKDIMGNSNGRFIVGELNPEYSDLTMNKSLLESISNTTDGKFYSNTIKDLFNDIKAKDNFKEKFISKKQDYALWNLPLFLIISLLCFSIEWVIRKLSGLI